VPDARAVLGNPGAFDGYPDRVGQTVTCGMIGGSGGLYSAGDGPSWHSSTAGERLAAVRCVLQSSLGRGDDLQGQVPGRSRGVRGRPGAGGGAGWPLALATGRAEVRRAALPGAPPSRFLAGACLFCSYPAEVDLQPHFERLSSQDGGKRPEVCSSRRTEDRAPAAAVGLAVVELATSQTAVQVPFSGVVGLAVGKRRGIV